MNDQEFTTVWEGFQPKLQHYLVSLVGEAQSILSPLQANVSDVGEPLQWRSSSSPMAYHWVPCSLLPA